MRIPWIRRALECAEDRFLVGYTDMYAGIDCTLGLRGTERMCLDLMLHPQQLKELIDRAWAEYPAVYRHFDQIQATFVGHALGVFTKTVVDPRWHTGSDG